MTLIDCSVLIIDDQASDRYILKRLLNKANIQGKVFEAEHGEQALEFMADYKEGQRIHGDSFPPQFILLDINMPIMNGFEFLEAFTKLSDRKHEYRSIVFTMITSSMDSDDYQKARSFDCVADYFAKDQLDAKRLNEIFQNKIALFNGH